MAEREALMAEAIARCSTRVRGDDASRAEEVGCGDDGVVEWLRANNYLDADRTGVWRVHCAARVGR